MTPSEAAAILNVTREASVADIDRAFQRRARMSHPDRFVGATDADIRAATATFVRLTEARDVLRATAQKSAREPDRAREANPERRGARTGEPLSFAEFVRVRDARAWLAPPLTRSMSYRDGARRVAVPRRAHREWIVIPTVFVVLTVAIWVLTILLPG